MDIERLKDVLDWAMEAAREDATKEGYSLAHVTEYYWAAEMRAELEQGRPKELPADKAKEMRDALKACAKALNVAMECDEGVDVFGVHHNDANDALSAAERLAKE